MTSGQGARRRTGLEPHGYNESLVEHCLAAVAATESDEAVSEPGMPPDDGPQAATATTATAATADAAATDAAAADAAAADAAERQPFEATEAADAVVRLLGAPTLRRLDVAANTGICPEQTRRFWHALGFAAAASEDDARYTISDQEAIARTVSILASGKVDERVALSLTRAIARSLERLASWQSSLIMESVLRAQPDPQECDLRARAQAPTEGQPPRDLAAAMALEQEADEQLWHRRLSPEAARQAGELLLDLVDDIEPLIIYAWRRHLAATIGRLMTNTDVDLDEGANRAVGFADMAGFTTLVRRLSERQLARLVQQFEELVAEIVAGRGGRIVKMLGDEVVYTADSAQTAGTIALDLLEFVARDPSMPQLRIGMAYGPVLSHLGDIFGTTVNRASRLTSMARPHTVVVDDALASHLADIPGFAMNRLPPRALRGLGMTVVWHLFRENDTPTR